MKGPIEESMNKKRIYIYVIPACIALTLIAIIGWGYTHLSFQEEQVDTDLYTLIPANSEAILEANDLNALNKTIQNSHYADKYHLLHISELLKILTHNIDVISRQQAHGLSTEMNSQLIVSFHAPGTVHDQVIYGRFGKGDINSITRLMRQNKGNAHTPKTLVYQGEEIIIYPIGNNFLACYFQPGFFAVSFQEKLIEKVIDAYKNGHSVATTSPSLNSLRKQTKHNEPLSLYLHPENNDKEWIRYDIRMNASAIYLANYQTVIDTCKNEESIILHKRLDDKLLPGNIQLIVQKSFVHSQTPENISPQATLNTILAENGCKEIDLILFSQPTSTDTLYHQLLMVPIPISYIDQLKTALRYPLHAKRRASIWLHNTPYPIWQCEADSTLNSYFVAQQTANGYWLSIYQNNLLVATTRETLHHYLTDIHEEKSPMPHTSNKKAYIHCLEDLAEESNFTMVTDLNDFIYQYPRMAENSPWIPSLFLKHKDFFKHFMLSTQHIHTDGHISSQVILTYQGDSLLSKQARN